MYYTTILAIHLRRLYLIQFFLVIIKAALRIVGLVTILIQIRRVELEKLFEDFLQPGNARFREANEILLRLVETGLGDSSG